MYPSSLPGRNLHLSALALALAATLVVAPAFAQSTSSGVGGQVFSAEGQPVVGAEVTITHTESGTVNRAITDASGRYAARGLRVGGPYTITITKPGEGTRTEDNVYLNLNQVSTINATLTGDLTTLDTISAVASANLGGEVFSANKMGTGTNVTRESLELLPSATRNMQDFIRLDPRITQVNKAEGGISAGGQNTRYNAVRIDGIGAGDPFGLERNNFPTERQPVSMDAIQEINIDLANYDTTIFGGIGAVVNAVTRSGTNTYSGTTYYSLRDGDWVRKRLRGSVFNGFDKEETYGMTFGGPIIKDKLFFFGNYERYVRAAAGSSLAATPYGRGEITDADIAAITTAAQNFGFDPGGVNPPGENKTEIEEYALKLDWNINENHRAAVRYNHVEQTLMRFPGIGESSVALSEYWYTQPKTYETFMGELFSGWSENFTTELKASWKDYTAIRAKRGDFPAIEISGFGPNRNQSVNLGTERNSHINIVESKELSLFAAANWYVGDHTIKFGFDHQANEIMNFFGRNTSGVYAFSSLADFQAGRPRSYSIHVPRPGRTMDDIPAIFTIRNTGLFLQDTWAINYNLNLMFGVRVDNPGFSDQPLHNQQVQDIYGYDNTYTPKDKLIQPRLGFNYTFDSARPTQLRGGLGLFSGAVPNVWLSGAYLNTGLNYVEYICSGDDAPDFSASKERNIPSSCGPSNSRANVDIIEPGFKLPSSWKTNLAFDHELPWYGIVASFEALFTRVNDGVAIRRLDLYDAQGNGPTATGPDGRPLFWNAAGLDPANRGNNGIDPGVNGAATKANRPDGMGNILLIRNTDKGSSRQITLGLDKPLLNDWGWSLFYTYTRASEVSPQRGSTNPEAWGSHITAVVNDDTAQRSRYAIRDRLSGQLHWQRAFFGDYKTKVSVFYEGHSGRPFSYIFYNDANGDGEPDRTGRDGYYNDLFYVPAGPGDVLWTGGQAMEDQFFAWLDGHELSAYKGRIAPANGFRSGWSNTFDMRISQELPGFFKHHKTELALDIMNVGNLINKDWGLIVNHGFEARSRVAYYAGIDPDTGKYVYHFTGRATDPSIQENNNDKGNTGVSRWSVMLSVKYRF